MLATEERRIRWLGMDMQSRWRRRAAVLVGYAGFLVGIGLTQDDRWGGHPVLAALGMVVLTMGWKRVSVFRGNGMVKSFEDPPEFGGLQKKVMVNGLDEWARYRYDVASFEAANEEQQAELLKRYRVGTFLLPAKASGRPWWLDERERGERDRVARWALKWVASYLAVVAGCYVGHAARHRQVDAMAVVGDLWALVLLALTLPQARVLWTEPDPRDVSGEMELVEREA